MCLIAASQTGAIPSPEIMQNAGRTNDDGFGIVYFKDGALIRHRTLELKEVPDLFAEASGHPYVAHWRLSTHGLTDVNNCHPYEVCSDIYAAHNGIFYNVATYNHKMSDTWHFIQEYVRPLYFYNKNFLDDPICWKYLDELVGNSKMAFLTRTGRIYILSVQLGLWKDEVWYSNSHSLYSFKGQSYGGVTEAHDYGNWWSNQRSLPAHYQNSGAVRSITPVTRNINNQGSLPLTVIPKKNGHDGVIKQETNEEKKTVRKVSLDVTSLVGFKAPADQSMRFDAPQRCEMCNYLTHFLINYDDILICEPCFQEEIINQGIVAREGTQNS